MKKYIRKSFALLVILATLLTSFSGVSAAQQLISQTVEKQTITSGVTLESYDRFTTSGWIKSYVLRVDLSNKNVKVDTLVNKKSVVGYSTVLNLAKNSGAIAAVNGSFFDFGPSGSGKGYTYGPVVSSGEIDLAATRDSKDTATFSLNDVNEALFTYWNTKVELVTPKGERKVAASYNRYNGKFNGMSIVDSKWGAKTPGATSNYPYWIEMVVEDGIVKEFNENKPSMDMPKNGFVVLGAGSHIQYLKDNFNVGDPVEYNITMNVDTNNMKMALTGGAMLVKDDKVLTSFSHNPVSPSTRASRTAIGTSKDGKTLIVAAVDGRSSASIGMTQSELASYMHELGCANALNLDGGGSTTLVARKQGTTGLSVQNRPSDGSQRGVGASLGIFSVGPQGPVDSLYITSYEDYVFVNTSRAFTARGMDKYMNPVNINPKDIKWSVSGVKGTFKGNVLYPTTAGEAVVTAKIGDNVVGTCPITVLESPSKLEMNYDTLNVNPGSSITFSVKGWDKNGYTASIPPANIKWSTGGNVGNVSSSNVFTANKSGGTGYVAATVGSAVVSCPVSIRKSGLTKVIQDFNSTGIKLITSPNSAKASYSMASNVYKSAKNSAKITYDFSKDVNVNRTAYLTLPNGGYTLESSTSKLGMWVYSSAKKPIWIGATVHDSKGNYSSEYFAKGITWTGWKYLEVSLDNLNTPKKITNVFAVQPKSGKSSGTVYFDDLTMVYTGYPAVDMTKVPKTTVPKDDNYKESTVSGTDSMTFSVFGQSTAYSSSNKTQIDMLNTLASRINSSVDVSVLVGSNDGLTRSSIKIPQLATTASYKSLDINGNRLIQLNTSKGGIRATNTNEWLWLNNQLKTFDGKNLFVFLMEDPIKFNDTKEGQLLKDTLSNYQKETGKNVWVFYKGNSNSSYMDKGVKYVVTAGFDSYGFSDSNKSAAKYAVVKVKGTSITYQFKSFN
ncbi:phosphodiester glycosidase family protein [Ruminiclostridium cellulolyticum]|uniref:Ig-like, group 2 n=1 Tax=Ruminiclostridium cellulolyticum (strain ATCC 35319 / DSM 5812 / JCM 6584 / H10) TaxID=394503 RepID=B8I1Q9_RUMCH|nr:phosphodiester glycosidase family protein [Ruminiclostridium cellulolyticum]ACL77694.1 Ig-like, group 2 [Ruminiclostridium cellulolyticum H10]